jgi:hypothetical protein
MEVHHHPHTPRRKWSHYFWEFMMLFLAVFLGYMAEMRLEHAIEHQREKKFIGMMVQDLISDTTELTRIDTLRKKREWALDSLIRLIGKKDRIQYASQIYNLALQTDGYESFLRNDRTIQQLKYSGAMRLIRKDTVSSAIMKYDNFIISEVDWNNNIEALRINKYKELRFGLLDAQLINRLSKNDTTGLNYSFLPVNQTDLNMITGALFQVKVISETCRSSDDTAKQKALELIKLLQTEYHMK